MCDFKIWGDKLAGELNVMRWWFAGLGAFSAQGGPFGCCKCGAAAGLVCESAKNGPLPAKNCKPVAGSARLVHCFSKTNPKKAVWQATATVASAAEKRANLGQPGPKPVAVAAPAVLGPTPTAPPLQGSRGRTLALPGTPQTATKVHVSK